MSRFLSYPIINEKIIERIKYNLNEYKFYFLNKTQNLYDEIKVDTNNNPIIFKDQNKRWFYKNNNLKISKRVQFNPKALFGNDGVANINSKLGVGLFWKSKKTMKRGVLEGSTFTYNDDRVDEVLEITFDDKSIKDELELEVIVYLKEAITNSNLEAFATMPGTVLGVLEYKKLIFVGSGSTFPTTSINDPNGPLWELIVHLDFEASIDETVEFIINEGHSKFELLNINDKRKYNSDLVQEISINIIYQIVMQCITYKDHLENDYKEGTLGALVLYYVKTFELDLNVSQDIYRKISIGVRK